MVTPRLSPALIFIAFVSVLAVYSNSFQAPFLYDDSQYILENPHIREWRNAPRLFLPSTYIERKRNDNYRPVTFLSFSLNHALGQTRVRGYHLFNFAFHLLSAFLIFLLSRKLLSSTLSLTPVVGAGLKSPLPLMRIMRRDPAFAGPAPTRRGAEVSPEEETHNWIALLTALVFALHPVQTEVVTYISSRSDSLCTLFYLCSLWCFLKFFEISAKPQPTGSKTLYFFSLAAFLAALLSKEIAATLPLMLFFLDYLFLRGLSLKKVLGKAHWHLPYWILLALFIAFRFLHFGKVGDIAAGTYAIWNPYHYWVTQIFVVLNYLKIFLAPRGQSIDHFVMPSASLLEPRILASIGIWVLAGGFTFWLVRKYRSYGRLFVFAAVWFVVTLAPTSSFLPIKDAMAERRLYLPGWGLALFFTLTYFSIFSGLFKQKPKTAIGIFALILLSLGLFTWKRNNLYKNPELLWQEAFRLYPENFRAATNLGKLYYDRKDSGRALQSYLKAIEINPNLAYTLNNIGIIYQDQKDFPKALLHFQKAIKLNPSYAEAHYNLGNLYFESKDSSRALECFQKVLAISPDFPVSYTNLGNIYFERKDYSRAVQMYRKAIDLNPASILAHDNLGIVYYELKQYDRALEQFQIAAQLDPQDEMIRQKIQLSRNLARKNGEAR